MRRWLGQLLDYRTWVANEKVSAALMNTHWRDQISWIATAGITGWESYTPTWASSGTQPAIVDGTLAGTYCQLGKTVFGEARMTAAGSTTYGTGTYTWTLPVTAEAASRSPGGGIVVDASVGTYAAQLDIASTTTFALYTGGTTQTQVAATSPMTWVSTDYMRAYFSYEAA